MIPLPLLITLAGLITGLLCIPLALGKIGPNPFYGIRTRAAFSSEENWYRINKFGGKVFLASSGIITLAGLAGFLVPSRYLAEYGIGAAIVVLGSILGSAVITLLGSSGK